LVLEEEPDVLCITETWLSKDISSHLILVMLEVLSGFQVFRQDRESGRGGGVLIAVKKHLQPVLKHAKSAFGCEFVFVNIDVSDRSVSVINVYRPPDCSNAKTLSFCNRELMPLLSDVQDFILLGDFNASSIDWLNLTAHSSTNCSLIVAETILNISVSLGCTQLVTETTRLDNILDLLFSSSDDLVLDLFVKQPFATSDHNIITCSLNTPVSPPVVEDTYVYDFSKANVEMITSHFSLIDWSDLLSNSTDVDDAWNIFWEVFSFVIHEYVPMRKLSNNKPHFTKNFSRNIRFNRWRRIKQRRWIRWNNNKKKLINKNAYDIAAAELSKCIAESKRAYECRVFNNKNHSSRKFFSYIKSHFSSSSGIPTLNGRGHVLVKDIDKADELANVYDSFFVDDDGQLPEFSPPVPLIPHETPIFTDRDILYSIRKLKNNSASGFDGIPPSFLKLCKTALVSPLLVLFNKFVVEGALPSAWKTAVVVPISKGKSDVHDPLNYRPVSLTSVFSKCFEYLLRKNMLDFIFTNNILSPKQHGFLPSRSVVTNMLDSMFDWFSNIDNRVQTDIIYLDYSKAFDSVSHPKLLHKLKNFGFNFQICRLIESFLTGRHQLVKVGSHFSSVRNVLSGVPQGSVLGPLLFVLYTNDIHDCVKSSSLSLYADDSKLYSKIVDVLNCDLLENDLCEIMDW
jgi:hypothetical protein